MEDTEHIRSMVCERIEQVETAMESLQDLRKNLLHKAYEAKQSILSRFITERGSMQSKEMSLLVEVDQLLHSKDEALVIQLGKLSQVLGCLRNCLQSPHPCGDCLEKYDDIDMLSMDEVSMEFAVANDKIHDNLRDCFHPHISTLPPSPSMYMMEEADNMTKWLLTPSNNHVVAVDGEEIAEQQFLSTEWLVQHHIYSSRTGTDTADLFANVKSERKEEWLNTDRPALTTLCLTMFKLFEAVASQRVQDWIQKESESRDCDASDATSSLHSSCVIISGSTSSEGSSSVGNSYTFVWPKDVIPLSADYEVREWVATCQDSGGASRSRRSASPANSMRGSTATANSVKDSDVLSHARSRRTSINSARTYSLLDSKLHSDKDWLCEQPRKNHGAPSVRSSPGVTDSASWLQQPSQMLANVPVLSGLCDEWLTKPSAKLVTGPPYASSTFQLHSVDCCEEPSLLPSKDPYNDWLSESAAVSEHDLLDDNRSQREDSRQSVSGRSTGKSMLMEIDDWLTGEEKKDTPKKKRASSKLDTDWLLVKGELSRIASTSSGDWLVDNKELSFSSLNDNKYSELND